MNPVPSGRDDKVKSYNPYGYGPVNDGNEAKKNGAKLYKKAA